MPKKTKKLRAKKRSSPTLIPEIGSRVEPFTRNDVFSSLTEAAKVSRKLLEKAGVRIPSKIAKLDARVRAEGSSKSPTERTELEKSFRKRLPKP